MKILGIDPGYGISGYGMIEQGRNGLRMLAHGAVKTDKNESVPVRLAQLYNDFEQLIKEHKPDAIAVEELFFNTNITTGIRVAQARGVILLCCINNCGLLYEYTPLQVKMAVTGSGNAQKKQVQFMVKSLLNLSAEPKPDDAADALAIAICHAHTAAYAQRVLN